MTGFPRPATTTAAQRATLAVVGAILALLLAAAPGLAQFTIGGPKQRRTRTRRSSSRPTRSQYDDQLALTVAKGHVEISQGGEVLLADTVSYNQRTDTVTASGHVSLLSRPARSCSPTSWNCATG